MLKEQIISSVLDQAVALQRANRLTEAELVYRQILEAHPNHFDSIHMLGVIANQRGNQEEAVRQFDLALKINPNVAPAYCNRGVALKELKLFDEALASFDQAITLEPDYAEALYNRGNTLRELKRLEEALASYDKALALRPNYAKARYNRGITLHNLKRFEEALATYDEALALKPDYAEALNNRGNTLHNLKRFEEALASYDKALALKPDYAEALYNRGITLQNLKRFEEALANYDKALALKPDYAEALNNHGNTLQDLKRLEEALASYDKALAFKPDYAEALYNRGNTLQNLKRFEEALASYDKALVLKPDYTKALNNRGNTLKDLERLEEALASYDKAIALKLDYEACSNRGIALMELKRFEEALSSYDKALTLKPDNAGAFFNRGSALQVLKRLDEAISSYNRAIALKPDYADAFINRGSALQMLKRFHEALASYDHAIALQPDHADALINRGSALQGLKLFDEALANYEQAFALKPDHKYAWSGLAECAIKTCEWSRRDKLYGEVCRHVIDKKSIISPFVLLGCSSDAPLQLKCARSYIDNRIPVPPQSLWNGERYSHDRIRVAYLSADFRAHPVAYLTAELFECHNRAHFDVIGISIGQDDRSDTRTRCIKALDQFHDVRSKGDAEVAKLINELEIDIVIDLNGYTEDCRPEILSNRPAPIQVNYLGYPGTMGADFIDYIIADHFLIPVDAQQFYFEKIAYLPDTFQANDSKRVRPASVPIRSEMGLPDGNVVLCAFNNSYKINSQMFDVWMRLLQNIEGSLLWLIENSPSVAHNLRREAAVKGIDEERLVFAPRAPYADYLARYRLADIFLDTLPFNGGTTASDALWMGLPIVSCAGMAFSSRMSGSLLHAVGLPELVTSSLDEYEALALQLARNAPLLANIKAKLAHNRDTCPLFNSKCFTRYLETAYTTMWEIWQRGESPRSFSVAPKPEGQNEANTS